MAMSSIPARSWNTAGAAQQSRDTEPTSPTVHEPPAHQAPEGPQTFSGRHIDDLNRSFQVKKEVLTKPGRTLDEFVAGYRGDNQREHRATARHLVSMVLEEHLNTEDLDTSSALLAHG
ncbi:hypothetical protein E4U19_002157 [Claviceps sp. Clav32 group G5]|nr:hypothetical protein E4U19_002157 [Claviceps sp. Clav32 group G5]